MFLLGPNTLLAWVAYLSTSLILHTNLNVGASLQPKHLPKNNFGLDRRNILTRRFPSQLQSNDLVPPSYLSSLDEETKQYMSSSSAASSDSGDSIIPSSLSSSIPTENDQSNMNYLYSSSSTSSEESSETQNYDITSTIFTHTGPKSSNQVSKNVDHNHQIRIIAKFHLALLKMHMLINNLKLMASKAVTLYLDLLDKHAMATKCATAGVIGMIGDLLAQSFDTASHTSTVNTIMFFNKDMRRLLGVIAESVVISAPLKHVMYDFMESKVPIQSGNSTSKIRQWAAALFHVFFDCIILGPFYVASMMTMTSITEGRLDTLLKEMRFDFFPTFRSATIASVLFMPAQMIAFRSLPVKFRVMYMNLQDIVWNAVVSFMAHQARK